MIPIPNPRLPLQGKKALIVGVANEHSIAYGCAKAFRELGADLAITYLSGTQLPIRDIALSLGFLEPSAFHRAFRKWAHTSPGAYRRDGQT